MFEMWYNLVEYNHINCRGATVIAHGLSNSIGGAITMSHSTPQPSALKVCVDCKHSLPVAQFSKNRRSNDGLNSYCKPCASARYKRWREENQARRNEYMRQWHQANLEHEAAYKRERYRNDDAYRRHVLELVRAYRQRNADAVRQRHWRNKQAKGFQNNITRAHTTVSRAVRRGILPPAWSMVCDGCEEAQAAHWHHHKGYERNHWLDVVAMCLDCHGKEHRVHDK